MVAWVLASTTKLMAEAGAEAEEAALLAIITSKGTASTTMRSQAGGATDKSLGVETTSRGTAIPSPGPKTTRSRVATSTPEVASIKAATTTVKEVEAEEAPATTIGKKAGPTRRTSISPTSTVGRQILALAGAEVQAGFLSRRISGRTSLMGTTARATTAIVSSRTASQRCPSMSLQSRIWAEVVVATGPSGRTPASHGPTTTVKMSGPASTLGIAQCQSRKKPRNAQTNSSLATSLMHSAQRTRSLVTA